MSSFDLMKYLDFWTKRVEGWMDENITAYAPQSAGLTDAMRYSLFAGGKRLRPALVFSAYGIFESYFDKVTPYACAVEMLHTYSLIHDDLPAMDDDDLRRGKPTNHKVYGEATAILAGDALLTRAFDVMLDPVMNPDIPDDMKVQAALGLAKASGDAGMVAGQFADMQAENSTFDGATVDFIHMHKTAALLGYSCELGAILGFGTAEDRAILRTFGQKIGLAFQIIDDILDITSTSEVLGKDAGSDLEKGKATYPAIHGLDASRRMADKLMEEAISSLDRYAPANQPLVEIAKYITSRNK